ncbi:hypothetical protein HYR99_07650 [Candidatus Poribacteria bacterium]|nr:hypothetical protein [Candidatus Poribacteria bacterium]
MAIPALQANGCLPPGLYLASLDEIWERFGSTSEQRRLLFQRLQTFVTLARHVGSLRMFVNGSYVTAKTHPGDIDVVIWVDEDKFRQLVIQEDELAMNLREMLLTKEPKEAFVVFNENKWNAWLDFFSLIRNRPGEKKGLVEVQLR